MFLPIARQATAMRADPMGCGKDVEEPWICCGSSDSRSFFRRFDTQIRAVCTLLMRLRWSFRLFVAVTTLDYTRCSTSLTSIDGTPVNLHRFEEVINGREYKIEVSPVGTGQMARATGANPGRIGRHHAVLRQHAARSRRTTQPLAAPSRTEIHALSYSYRHARIGRRGDADSDSVRGPRVGGLCHRVANAERTAAAAHPRPAQLHRPPALPRVRLVATGGTISNRSGGRLTAEELVASMPGIERYVRPEFEQFANVASGSLTLKQWIELANRINTLFAEDADLAGIVVTSGTDTLEETAYFLDLTVRSDKPVVVVGSMRNPSTLGYEGAANLLEGYRVAGRPGDRAARACSSCSTTRSTPRAKSPRPTRIGSTRFNRASYGILGVVDADRVVYYRDVVKRHAGTSEFDVSRDRRAAARRRRDDLPGRDGDIIKAVVDQGAKGIVIAAAGAGATSGTQDEGIRYARRERRLRRHRPRGPAAAASRREAELAGSPRLQIQGEDLAPVKARILLMLALTRTSDGAEIQRMFTEY